MGFFEGNFQEVFLGQGFEEVGLGRGLSGLDAPTPISDVGDAVWVGLVLE